MPTDKTCALLLTLLGDSACLDLHKVDESKKGVPSMKKFFPGLYGNEATKDRLGTAIIEGRLPHALLIDGQVGSGKYTLALEIAAALNCERADEPGVPLPCHGCNTCRRVLSGGFTDLKLLEKDEGRATIGVDAVKELRRDMFLSANESNHKVYIIRDAEKLTPEAQNALLIVLEEPPRNVEIMLLASGTDRILTTIKSRTQYVAMSRFTPGEIKDYLIKTDGDAERIYALDREGFLVAMAGADGRIGMAKSLISKDGRESLGEEREETLAILRSIGRVRGFGDVYSAVTDLPKDRSDLTLSLERLTTAICDLIKVKHGAEGGLSFFVDTEEALTLADSMSTKKLFRLSEIINKAHSDNSKNANTNALLSTLAAELRMA